MPKRCTGWDELVTSVATCTPAWAETITGVPAEQIGRAAKMWGEAKTSFLLHAPGVEQRTQGVDNVLSLINLVLATGRDQLPGNRDIENPGASLAHLPGLGHYR